MPEAAHAVMIYRAVFLPISFKFTVKDAVKRTIGKYAKDAVKRTIGKYISVLHNVSFCGTSRKTVIYCSGVTLSA
jgi:hypothetical protein